MRMVRKVSGTSWLTLTRTNYGEWTVTMKAQSPMALECY